MITFPFYVRDQNWTIVPQLAQIEIQGPIKDLQDLQEDQITILVEKVDKKEDVVEILLTPITQEQDKEEEEKLSPRTYL